MTVTWGINTRGSLIVFSKDNNSYGFKYVK